MTTTSKPLSPSWGDIRYPWFYRRHKNWSPPPTHNTYPHKPHWLVLLRDERKRRRVVSEKRNCTNPLCSAVYAGNSRKECFTRFYLSLPSFLLQVIIGTPPAPTMPGGLLLVDSQTTGSASHPPCSTPLSFSFFPTPSCLLFTCSSLSLLRQDTFLHPVTTPYLKTVSYSSTPPSTLWISLAGFTFQFLIKYVETQPRICFCR